MRAPRLFLYAAFALSLWQILPSRMTWPFSIPSAQATSLYKYRDDTGTLHVVDSPEAIPPQFREKTDSLVRDPQERRFGNNPCLEKKKCGTIYISPWCNECLEQEAEYRELLKFNDSPARGLRVVVGAGKKQSDNNRYARSFGYGAMADDGGKIARELGGVSQYPAYFVQDEKGKVIKDGENALAWIRAFFSGVELPEGND